MSQQPTKLLYVQLDAEIDALPGDKWVFDIEAGTVTLMRGLAVVGVRNLIVPVTDVSDGHVPAATRVGSLFIAQEGPKMPGIFVTCTDVQRDGDQINVSFSDGEGLSFDNLAQVATECGPYDSDRAHAKKMMCLKMLRNSPDGADLTTIVGASIGSDFNADTPLVYTPAE